MDERVDDADITVEPSESPSEPLFPVVGVNLTPTPEMLAKGLHGNGAWDLTDESVQRAYAEVHQVKLAERDDRRNHYHERAKDALADAVDFHHRIIKRGHEVMDRVEDPELKVTAQDMTLLAMAQKSSKELADRGIGRAISATDDTSTTTSILSMIQRKD